VPLELQGLRILVVEDNFLVAELARDMLADWGCEIVGPVPRLDQALSVAAETALDGALLDINLAGEYSFPVATLLQERGVPFMFLTGYGDSGLIPPAFRQVPCLGKPFDPDALAAAAALHFGSDKRSASDVAATPPHGRH
jgi:CheY-like chemotaxis protein